LPPIEIKFYLENSNRWWVFYKALAVWDTKMIA
jgi:hypothetical protein